jgi:hypothetical protein
MNAEDTDNEGIAEPDGWPVGGDFLQLKEHWREYSPSRYAELEASGRLDSEAARVERRIEERRSEEYARLIARGWPPAAAEVSARETAVKEIVYDADESHGEPDDYGDLLDELDGELDDASGRVDEDDDE